MASRLEGTLSDFEGDLDRIDHLLDLVKSLRKFGAIKATDHDQNEFADAAIQLQENLREQRTDFPVLSGALLAYLTGRFEHFARSCVGAVADDIAEQCSCFDDLPSGLQKSLIENSGEVIRNPQRYGYDTVSIRGIATNLANSLQAQSGFSSINSECISLTEQNLRSKMLADLFNRVEIKDLWREIGKQTDIKLHFELESETDATRKTKLMLDKIMDERNTIAHPTGTMNLPGPDQVLSTSSFFRILAQVIVKICMLKIVAFTQSKN